ncbi:PD-(D/E)XK nuclease family protein [Lentisphaera marina]|uniref:PD-(D/E)XK nuclease family protein n=1 Tax=Lentisphaera marina TaxID=1111041 RepID=UPI0023652AF1|nr:PD-(D/E)XK nuclease family protein [Lentisphaera marina]MDD7987487.1 PD-(D/E)XK nuclease family protein [Lentisphaera marina]
MSTFTCDDIYLLKEEHEYKLKSDPSAEFTSCTTFIKQFFSPFDADAVAQKLVSSVPKYFGMSTEELKEEWTAAADHGTQVHEELEEFILSGTEPKEAKSIAGKNWLKNNIDLEKFALHPEVIIYCKELKLAGTIDLIAQHKKSGSLLLFDWKTNKRINKRSYKGEKGVHPASSNLDDCNFNHYSAQLSLYRYLLEKNYKCKIHRQIILHLDEAKSTVIDCDYLESTIQEMLRVI